MEQKLVENELKCVVKGCSGHAVDNDKKFCLIYLRGDEHAKGCSSHLESQKSDGSEWEKWCLVE